MAQCVAQQSARAGEFHRQDSAWHTKLSPAIPALKIKTKIWQFSKVSAETSVSYFSEPVKVQLVSVWKVPSEGLSFLATEAIELCVYTYTDIYSYVPWQFSGGWKSAES